MTKVILEDPFFVHRPFVDFFSYCSFNFTIEKVIAFICLSLDDVSNLEMSG